MRQLFRWTALALVLLALVLLGFIAWASSGTRTDDTYVTTVEYDVPALDPALSDSVAPDTFTVMTYNLGYLSGMTNNLPVDRSAELFAANMEAAAHLIARSDPDWVAFQEIDFGAHRSFYVNQLDTLARRLGYPYGAQAVNWDERYVPFPSLSPAHHFRRILSGQAVLSRHPIDGHERNVLSRPPHVTTDGVPSFLAPLAQRFYLDRLAQVVRLDVGGQPVILINVHLEAYDRATREEQAQQVLQLYRYYRDEYPVLLLGDFNSILPDDRESSYLTDSWREEIDDDQTVEILLQGAHLREAFMLPSEAVRPDSLDADSLGALPVATDAPGTPLGAAPFAPVLLPADETGRFTYAADDPRVKIDHIFYNADRIRPVEAFVVDGPDQPSDHRAVVMRFVLTPPAAPPS